MKPLTFMRRYPTEAAARKWFTEARWAKGISAMKLSEWLGVSYKSAWHLGHRIRSMMASEPALLQGVVELDETYVGGTLAMMVRNSRAPLAYGNPVA